MSTLPSVTSQGLANYSQYADVAKHVKKKNDEIDFQGFLKILNTKLLNQSPLINNNEEPLDAMKEMAQMMMVQHSSRQVGLMEEVLREIKDFKMTVARHPQMHAELSNKIDKISEKMTLLESEAHPHTLKPDSDTLNPENLIHKASEVMNAFI